jgi:uncharacterized protein YndB with AHSA1/START domain
MADQMRAIHDAIWAEALDRFAQTIQEHHADEPGRGGRTVAHGVTDGRTILTTIDLPATAERIFRALTSEEVEQWWGLPEVCCVRRWRSDLRVGGRWSLLVLLPDGSEFPSNGEYREIDAPRRVVFTLCCDCDCHEPGEIETTVTYQLDAIATGTRVTVRHDGLYDSRVAADAHADGWLGFLNDLGKYIQAEVIDSTA